MNKHLQDVILHAKISQKCEIKFFHLIYAFISLSMSIHNSKESKDEVSEN